MNREEVRRAVDAEVEKIRSTLHTVDAAEVKRLYAAFSSEHGPGPEALRGTRTELSAALQVLNPAPYSLPLHEASQHVTRAEREAMHDRVSEQVTDQHRILSDHARSVDPVHTDARHFAQKLHGRAIWTEVDRLVAAHLGGAS